MTLLLILSGDDETPMTVAFDKPLRVAPTATTAPPSTQASGQIQQGGR